jgi:hypothetical protein
MAEVLLGAARLFASHYQFVICDDPSRMVADEENWSTSSRGFAGRPQFRMIGTEADLNDHWVELCLSELSPSLDERERVICVHFRSEKGAVHLMSVVDAVPPITAAIVPGDYAAYVAGQNLGIDQLALGETAELSDAELAARKDLEWYRIFLVPGISAREGDLTKPA